MICDELLLCTGGTAQENIYIIYIFMSQAIFHVNRPTRTGTRSTGIASPKKYNTIQNKTIRSKTKYIYEIYRHNKGWHDLKRHTHRTKWMSLSSPLHSISQFNVQHNKRCHRKFEFDQMTMSSLQRHIRWYSRTSERGGGLVCVASLSTPFTIYQINKQTINNLC